MIGPRTEWGIVMKTALLASLLTIGLGTALATTTSELVLSNSTNTIMCTISASGLSGINGGCAGLTGDTTVGASSIGILNGTFTIDGGTVWDINVVDGISRTPNTNPGLDVTSETAVCESGNCNNSTLLIFFSDIGFTTATGGFVNTFSATDAASGSATQRAWVSTTDGLDVISGAGTTLIGQVGPFTGTGFFGGSVSGGGAAGPSAYSLTLEQAFTSDAQYDSFSVDGSVSAVPEPMSLLLLGGCLLIVGRKLAARLALS